MMALAWLDRHELLLGQQLSRLESQERANPLLLSIKQENETPFVLLPLSQGQIPER